METNRLRQFCTVVETGNLRKAAELLRISHSGLSKSMDVLENDIGTPLFLPSGRGIVISDEGLKLYKRCTPFFTELGKLLGGPAAKDSSLLRIGSFEVFTSYFVGTLLKDYLHDVEVEIHELLPGRLEEALLFDKVDLGITYEPIPRKGIEYVEVTSLEMGAYVAQGAFRGIHALQVPFVVPVTPLEGAPSGVKGRDGWPDENFKRNVRYRVDLMTTGLELVRQRLCAIFIPKFVARLHNESVQPDFKLEAVELPKGFAVVKRKVFIIKRESMIENKSLRQIAKALRKIC